MRGMPGDHVILVGFMGAGKSSVGRRLARRLGRRFVETDALIAARDGHSIPEIFERAGEARFRQLETEVVEALREGSGAIVATVLNLRPSALAVCWQRSAGLASTRVEWAMR